jgi:undecaprenyl diphosphate synthase
LSQAKVPAGLDRKEAEIYLRLDPERFPQHIAIIMDGNGRWAHRRHLPRVAGHRAGVASVRSTVETAARVGIPAVTLYAFSEENWKKRPTTEVSFLMTLLRRYLKQEVPTLNRNNIRLEYIGREHELPPSVHVDEQAIARHLYTRHLPDPDLVIRTSGEMRLSNFLLWQLAYAEIYVTPTLWPEFRGQHLLEAIAEYQKRERRYGGLVNSHHGNGAGTHSHGKH